MSYTDVRLDAINGGGLDAPIDPGQTVGLVSGVDMSAFDGDEQCYFMTADVLEARGRE